MKHSTQKKVRLIFKKGIRKIIFPFLLTDFSPWQDQIAEQTQKTREKFLPRKNVEWGYKIENGYADSANAVMVKDRANRPYTAAISF